MLKKIAVSLIIVSTSIAGPNAFGASHSKSLSTLGANDIMFAQGMIPHHQQAIDISIIALKQSTNKDVKSLANQIIKEQKSEIAQMKYWLKVKNAPMSMGHDMGMSGMLSERQVAELAKLKGQKFDVAFLNDMIAHHQGALEMTTWLSGSKNSEAKKLAKSIRSAQSTEISRMEKLLSSIK